MANSFDKNPEFDPEAREKLQLAQYFIKCYVASRQGLWELGILRSERSLQSDYAEWLASRLLQLELAPNTVQKGYDAKDSNGYTYQIKSRLVKTIADSTSFDMKPGAEFDYLLGVFSQDFDLLGIIRVPYSVVLELAKLTQGTFSFRWNKRNASDPRITYLVWPDTENR